MSFLSILIQRQEQELLDPTAPKLSKETHDPPEICLFHEGSMERFQIPLLGKLAFSCDEKENFKFQIEIEAPQK